MYQIAEYLSDLGKMCDPVQSLAYATIIGYCTTISAVHNGFGDGPSASNHQVLHTLMRENHGLRIETDLGLSQGARSLAQGQWSLCAGPHCEIYGSIWPSLYNWNQATGVAGYRLVP